LSKIAVHCDHNIDPRYNSNVEVKHGDNVPLNGDHTHFIMIDDGSRYRFFGKSTEFITRDQCYKKTFLTSREIGFTPDTVFEIENVKQEISSEQN
jgi:hypothetical protein